jgi:signal transduction histidine kinase
VDGSRKQPEVFTRLARIGAAHGGDASALLREACTLAAEAFGLRRCAVYRPSAGGELVPVAACGDGPPPPERSAVVPLPGRDRRLGLLAGDADDVDYDAFGAFADLLGAFLEQALEHERLQRLGDLKSHFIALASHELRAPVAVVHGIGATLDGRRGQLGAAEVERLHRALREHTAHLAGLVNQLLDLSRLDADAIELRRREIEVRPALEAIVAGVVPDRADAVEIEVEPELRTQVDPDAFERIVSNLVVNAVRYGAPPVRISAEQRDTHFRLAVEDRGDGVRKEFVPRLFQRFARAEDAAKGGSGLGLAIAQSYANAHGGELVYGEAEPKGARFELVLPRPHASG